MQELKNNLHIAQQEAANERLKVQQREQQINDLQNKVRQPQIFGNPLKLCKDPPYLDGINPADCDKKPEGPNTKDKHGKKYKRPDAFGVLVAFSGGKDGTLCYGSSAEIEAWRTKWGKDALPVRGKGPIGSKDSSGLDCVLVAARLLSVSRTVIDVGGVDVSYKDWMEKRTNFEQKLLNLIYAPWNVMEPSDNQERKLKFLQSFRRLYNIASGKFLDAIDPLMASKVFDLLVGCMAQQFEFKYTPRDICLQCGYMNEVGEKTARQLKINIYPHDPKFVVRPTHDTWYKGRYPASREVNMASWIEDKFTGKRQRCPNEKCRARIDGHDDTLSVGQMVVHQELPTRLAVRPVLMQDAPSFLRNIPGVEDKFFQIKYPSYQDADEIDHGLVIHKRARYRWIGGIYTDNTNKHSRVYWLDHVKQEEARNAVVFYDGSACDGLMIGGLTERRELQPLMNNRMASIVGVCFIISSLSSLSTLNWSS